MTTTICLSEDRETCEPCLKLLLLSLNKHFSRVPINLFYPPANGPFQTWIKKYSQVRLRTDRLTNASGWNVKPRAIMHLLDRGFDEVIWIDSDIIINLDLNQIFDHLENNVFVATEDALGDDRDDRNALRARLWGFPVGRVLPFGLNSGVLRVTRDHYHLMERWWELLQSNSYQDSQKKEWLQRPVHMLGDQDVLTALVTSKEFSGIPIQILRRGKHIIQFNGVYGYTVAERMRNLFGGRPAFIHSLGAKPWSEGWVLEPAFGVREYLKKLYLDLSPYTISAKRFKQELESDTQWMEPHFVPSKILRVLALGRPELVGLPIAALMDLARIATCMKKSRHSNPSSPGNAGQRIESK